MEETFAHVKNKNGEIDMDQNILMPNPGDMPALRGKRNPTTAAIIGLLFGGIGLGIYFASFIDFIIPLVITIGLYTVLSQIGFIGGAVIAAVWGYFRAVDSNKKLAQL
jgi:hypothetical protein